MSDQIDINVRNADIEDLRAELESARAELEVERMRLAACGVVALANTPDSAAKAREMLPEYRSGSLEDVIRAVDSEMELREQLAAEQAKNMRLREALEYSIKQVPELATVPGISKALSTTSDTSALEAMIAKAGEKMRERCAVKADWFIPFVGGKIRALPAVTLEDLK